jgi:hypothetical protein
MELKERKKALRGVLTKLKVNAVRAKEEERKRLQMNREIKLRNKLRNEKYQVMFSLLFLRARAHTHSNTDYQE